MSKYYIDHETGNDEWDGLSKEYSGENHGPWKTAGRLFNAVTIHDEYEFKPSPEWSESLMKTKNRPKT